MEIKWNTKKKSVNPTEGKKREKKEGKGNKEQMKQTEETQHGCKFKPNHIDNYNYTKYCLNIPKRKQTAWSRHRFLKLSGKRKKMINGTTQIKNFCSLKFISKK